MAADGSHHVQRQAPADATRAIHHGESFADETGTVMPPIFSSSTFAHGNAGGFDYTRSGNPNFRILERVLASVEHCNHATVFGSGVSAITAIVSGLSQGDLVICEENLYGCTVRLFEQVFAKFGGAQRMGGTSPHPERATSLRPESPRWSGWRVPPTLC